MALDSRFLSLLCCPVSKRPLFSLSRAQLDFLNRAIARGEVQGVDGQPIGTALRDALISDDMRVIYRIDDGIPVLLPDAGIGTTQLHDFPK
jgi:uncharacterized protein